VAVLISTEYAETPDTPNDSDAWYDTVLTYCMLRKNGFADEDIYVMYGFGSDGFYIFDEQSQTTSPAVVATSTGPPASYYEPPYCIADAEGGALVVDGSPITDYPVAYWDGDGMKDDRCLPQELFDCLAGNCSDWARSAADSKPDFATVEPVDGNDFLYVWWRGHGNVKKDADDSDVLHLTLPAADDIPATEIAMSVKAIPAGQQLLVFETCHSGCMTQYVDTTSPPAVLMASSGCDEESNRDHLFDVRHGVWSYLLAGTLQGGFPNADDGLIELEDGSTIKVQFSPGGPVDVTFKESRAATVKLYPAQNPELDDESILAKAMRLDVVGPAPPALVPGLPQGEGEPGKL
jgi:hypothetical protein